MLASRPMRAAGEGGAWAPRAPAGALAASALAAVVLVWALFFGGGSSDLEVTWLGVAAVASAAVLAAVTAAGRLRVPDVGRSGAALLVALAAFALWNGVTIAWSIQPDRTWSYTNRGLVYLAFACVGVFFGALVPRSARVLAYALAALLAGVLGWALLGKIVPSLYPDGGRLARLRSPIDYWNALALLGDVALALGLWLASRRRHGVTLRVAGPVLVYLAVLSILLAYSRAGVVVGVVLVACWLVLDPARLESLAALVCSAPVAALVAAWALTQPGIADDGQPYSTRVHDGVVFGVIAGIGLAFVIGAAIALLRYEDEIEIAPARRRELVRWTLVAASVLAVLAFGASTVHAGGPSPWLHARWHEFTSNRDVTQERSRIRSFSSNHRWAWWKESWRTWEDHPLGGTGAGTFALVHRPLRTTSTDVTTEPHNLPLQFLSETGLVGFALFAGLVVAAALVVRDALRRVGDADRSAVVVLALAPLAYFLWGLVDFDWDFVAVTGPAFLVLGALATAGRGPTSRLRPRPVWAAGAAAVALGVAFSLVSPWLSQRRYEESLRAFDRRDLAGSIQAAKEAHSLNPLSLDPLLVWAGDLAVGKDVDGAKRLYRKAVKLQPRNPEGWYQFGAFELEVDCYALQAYRYLNRAYTLDPFGPTAELDLARRIVNELARSGRPLRARCARP